MDRTESLYLQVNSRGGCASGEGGNGYREVSSSVGFERGSLTCKEVSNRLLKYRLLDTRVVNI